VAVTAHDRPTGAGAEPPASSSSPAVRGETIVELARDRGFPLVGVVPAEPIDPERVRAMQRWLAAGKHGTMAYLEEHAELRAHPGRLLDGARSIVVVADQYAGRNDPPDPPAERRPGVGRIARYARGDDYHKLIKKRLHALADELQRRWPAAQSRAFVDTGPIMERELAARAGIGWTGKHTLTIHPRRGSYLLLGSIITTLEITPPKNQRPTPDYCGTCTRCIDACPTDAITPYSVDATRCIGYLTIERREPIDPRFFEPMGDWLFGCDICQEVCPHNSPRSGKIGLVRRHPAYAPRTEERDLERGRTPDGSGFDLLTVLDWSADDRIEAFTKSAMKRATLAMMKRNALIVLGNAVRANADVEECRTWRARIGEIAQSADEPQLVRTTAAEVLRGLGEAGG
jgi:epoxyqueuosine reductase